MSRRLDAGATVAALGGALLAVSLFLDWYGRGRDAYTAWTVFELIDLLLAVLGLLAVSAFVNRSGLERRAPDAPLVILGAAALAIVVSQLLNHPPAATELDHETGAWLALAGAALMLTGGVMSAARISLAVSVEHREPDGAAVEPARPPAEPETVRLPDSGRPPA